MAADAGAREAAARARASTNCPVDFNVIVFSFGECEPLGAVPGGEASGSGGDPRMLRHIGGRSQPGLAGDARRARHAAVPPPSERTIHATKSVPSVRGRPARRYSPNPTSTPSRLAPSKTMTFA